MPSTERGEAAEGLAMPLPLRYMLQEPMDSVIARQDHALETLLAEHGDRVVLFGAGALGGRVLSALRSIGVEPLAFCDNNRSRWGSALGGVTILSPAEAATRFSADALFLVSVWNPAHWFLETRAQLAQLGCAYVSPIAPVFWRFADTFLPFLLHDRPSRVYENREQVLAAESLWADETSRAIYRAHVTWYATGDTSAMPPRPKENTYFPADLFSIAPQEVVVDCGAFDGDTIRQVLSRSSGSFGAIHAIEGDPVSLGRLQESLRELPETCREKVHVYHFAICARRMTLRFEATGGDGSKICTAGGVEVEGVPIDELFAHTPITMLKMDIEGAEYEALLGARKTLQRDRPILAICVYHTQNDIWRIPLLMRELLPDHRLYLRAYEGDGFQTVAYAVPPERVVGGSATHERLGLDCAGDR